MNANITSVVAIIAGLGAIASLIMGWMPQAQAIGLLFAALSVFGIRQAQSAAVTGGHSIF